MPTQPRKVKRWLRALPLINIGETTRQFYNNLKALNRQQIIGKERLEILEAMQPTAGLILANLNKHLMSRSLPLPPKSYRIVQLQQSLLSELAAGYRILVTETNKGELQLAKKSIALITHRALRYLGQRLLSAYRIYAPAPKGVWQEINKLYLFAEKRDLLDRVAKDTQYREISRSSILDVYKQINLLALAKPISLRQGEAEKLTVFLEKACRHCTITDSLTVDGAENVYFVNTNLDNPPQYAIKSDIAISSFNRYFEPNNLIERLKTVNHATHPDPVEAIVTPHALSTDLRKRVLSALTSNPKRRSVRIEKNTLVSVAIGISDIHRAINEDVQNLWSEQEVLATPAEFMLMLMPKAENENYIIPPELDRTGSSYAWDMVAKGNVILDRFEQSPGKAEIKDDSVIAAGSCRQTWKILDSSAGGYHLFWKGDQSSKAQVGELLALRETHNDQHHWRLGMIRWMQYHTSKGLDVGIKMLSPKTLTAFVESEAGSGSRQQQNSSDRTPVLILPPVAIINQPQSLVIPAGAFQEGDKLVLKLLNGKSNVKLTSIDEHSGAFCKFRYIDIETADPDMEDELQEMEALWSNL